MWSLIRRTLWFPVLILLLSLRQGTPLIAEPLMDERGDHMPSSARSAVALRETDRLAPAYAGAPDRALDIVWVPSLATGEGGAGSGWALQGTECSGSEALAYEASCDCVRPCDSCIDLAKEGPSSAQPGELITYTLTVTNCGSTLLRDVWVADYRVFGCAKKEVGNLEPGESHRFQAPYRVPLEQCGDLVNLAWAVGRSTDCFGVCDKDWWIVDVPCGPGPAAGIEIAKRPQSQTIEYGTEVTFAITVTNTGEVALDSVVVDDPRALECSRLLGSLPAGGSTTYQCTIPGVTQTFTNVIAVTASTPSDETVFDDDEAQVVVAVPGIECSKSPDLSAVERGEVITFTVGITNSGELGLGPVIVRDPIASACDRSFEYLDVGAAIHYQCTSQVVTGSFTNTVYATGTTPAGLVVTAQDTARVVVGSVAIEKYLGIGGVPAWQPADTPPGPPVLVGTPVWFWLMARNTGEAELAAVTLTDSTLDLLPYTECVPPATLQPGEVFDCVVGPLYAEIGQHSDVGRVTGQLAGRTFAAEDSVYYLGYNGSGASIDLEKYISIDGGEWDDADAIDNAPEVPAGPGDQPLVQFLFAVMNTGAVPLYEVSVTDTDLDLSTCPAIPSPLGTGVSYQCIVELPKALPCLQTNVATATGYHNGLPYRDTDAVHYQGIPCYTPTSHRVYLPVVRR